MTISALSAKLLVCHQTWFDGTASEAGVSCGKNWITVFMAKVIVKVQYVSESLNACLDDIVWTMEHFVTKLGMCKEHHELECPA